LRPNAIGGSRDTRGCYGDQHEHFHPPVLHVLRL
jgi:hypothetical protein